jgi:pyruvate,water dikinase
MQVLREQGKALFLQAVDVGRAASAVLSDDLVAAGVLQTPSDLSFLTAAEVLGEDPIVPGVVERRRAQHERSLATDLPDAWNGDPQPIPLPRHTGVRAAPGTVVRGLGVSAGTVTGRVWVVHDISDQDLDIDDVLVCRTTDPSWASLMAISAALVIDVGGAISHGAIVARELGIPCVIGTGDGTRVLSDGDTVTVDGNAGTVLVTESSTDGGQTGSHELPVGTVPGEPSGDLSGDPGGGVAG